MALLAVSFLEMRKLLLLQSGSRGMTQMRKSRGAPITSIAIMYSESMVGDVRSLVKILIVMASESRASSFVANLLQFEESK